VPLAKSAGLGIYSESAVAGEDVGAPMAGITDTSHHSDLSPAPTWRLTLLGAWRLADSEDVLEVGVNGRRLFALLALRGRCDRAYLSGTLWPECSTPHAYGNLRATLSRLHRRGLDGPLACSASGVMALRPEVGIDVIGVVVAAREVLDGDPVPEPRRMARRLACPDLLTGWYEDWVLLERERLRQLRLHALEKLSARLLADGEPAAAVEAALDAVTIEPLRESAHACLIRAHLAEGNRTEARRQFQLLRQLLRQELDEEPSSLVSDLLR
jgi:DNA-binding SARP family transcriptional activator